MIDTCIRLNGEAAINFHNMMVSADLESIRARDSFISDVHSETDEFGTLSIDVPDLQIDLSVLDSEPEMIKIVSVSKRETYIGKVSINYVSGIVKTNNQLNEKNDSYRIDKNNYYKCDKVYSISQSIFIKYAA